MITKTGFTMIHKVRNFKMPQAIFDMCATFEMNHGQKADYIMLGHEEFFDLFGHASMQMLNAEWPTHFNDYELILCDRPGMCLGLKDSKEWSMRLNAFETRIKNEKKHENGN